MNFMASMKLLETEPRYLYHFGNYNRSFYLILKSICLCVDPRCDAATKRRRNDTISTVRVLLW